jgi:hypothetical protein
VALDRKTAQKQERDSQSCRAVPEDQHRHDSQRPRAPAAQTCWSKSAPIRCRCRSTRGRRKEFGVQPLLREGSTSSLIFGALVRVLFPVSSSLTIRIHNLR